MYVVIRWLMPVLETGLNSANVIVDTEVGIMVNRMLVRSPRAAISNGCGNGIDPRISQV